MRFYDLLVTEKNQPLEQQEEEEGEEEDPFADALADNSLRRQQLYGCYLEMLDTLDRTLCIV